MRDGFAALLALRSAVLESGRVLAALPGELRALAAGVALLAAALGLIAAPLAAALPIVAEVAPASPVMPFAGGSVPYLLAGDDPIVPIVVRTISYRGDHYDAKESPRAAAAERARIEALRRERDAAADEPRGKAKPDKKAKKAAKKDKRAQRSSVDRGAVDRGAMDPRLRGDDNGEALAASPADDSAARIAAARRASQQALLAYARADLGKRGPQLGLPSTLWCMDFVNRLLTRLGLPSTGSRMARSPLSHPAFERVAKPEPGDIVVIARGRGTVYGHVALFNGHCGRGGIRLLGGNQGGGRVTDQCVTGRAVVGYVRPKATVAEPQLATLIVRGALALPETVAAIVLAAAHGLERATESR